MLFELISRKMNCLRDKSVYLEVYLDCNFNFGMISEKKLVEYLISEDAVCLFNEQENLYYNLLFVLDVCIYAISPQLKEYCEVNNSFKIISSQGGFWITSETEYKIETETGEAILRELSHSQKNEFIFSSINVFTNYERYFKYEFNNRVEYVAILGKRNWKRQMGLKHKKNTDAPILTRNVCIIPYSNETLIRYVEKLFDISYGSIQKKRLPPYYKKKIRLICLDMYYGILYGISNSLSKPLTKRKDCLNQIEIEFWSVIRAKDDSEKDSDNTSIDYMRFNTLIRFIEELLPKGFITPGRTKVQWLEEE